MYKRKRESKMIHITKEDIINALRTEVQYLSSGRFFETEQSIPLTPADGMFHDFSNYPHLRLKNIDVKDLRTCKVCAVGAVLRNNFPIDELSKTDILTQAVGTDYCVVDEFDSEGKDFSIFSEEDENDFFNSITVINAIQSQKWLSVLSQLFETIGNNLTSYELRDEPVIDYLVSVVKRRFPDYVHLTYSETTGEGAELC